MASAKWKRRRIATVMARVQLALVATVVVSEAILAAAQMNAPHAHVHAASHHQKAPTTHTHAHSSAPTQQQQQHHQQHHEQQHHQHHHEQQHSATTDDDHPSRGFHQQHNFQLDIANAAEHLTPEQMAYMQQQVLNNRNLHTQEFVHHRHIKEDLHAAQQTWEETHKESWVMNGMHHALTDKEDWERYKRNQMASPAAKKALKNLREKRSMRIENAEKEDQMDMMRQGESKEQEQDATNTFIDEGEQNPIVYEDDKGEGARQKAMFKAQKEQLEVEESNLDQYNTEQDLAKLNRHLFNIGLKELTMDEYLNLDDEQLQRVTDESKGIRHVDQQQEQGEKRRSIPTRHLMGDGEPVLSKERAVMVMKDGQQIVLGFYKESAPETSKHILDLFRSGLYETDDFFRIDAGFVAQTSEVLRRRKPIPDDLADLAKKKVPGEFQTQTWPNSPNADGGPVVRHKEGELSLARFQDPDSGTSSFSIVLGDAPHLDGQYTIFGKVVSGLDVVKSWEDVETKKEGIFVMPKERIEIASAYVLNDNEPRQGRSTSEGSAGGGDDNGESTTQSTGGSGDSSSSVDAELHKTRAELHNMKSLVDDLRHQIHKTKKKLFP